MHLEQQKAQHAHDVESDPAWTMPKPDRMKSYGFRLAVIVGKLAAVRGDQSGMLPLAGEAYATALSSANMLGIDLDHELAGGSNGSDVPLFEGLADAAGQYSDAAEKIDHLEDFVSLLRSANVEIVRTVAGAAAAHGFDLGTLAEQARRRATLSALPSI